MSRVLAGFVVQSWIGHAMESCSQMFSTVISDSDSFEFVSSTKLFLHGRFFNCFLRKRLIQQN